LKKIIILFFICINLILSSKEGNNKIIISDDLELIKLSNNIFIHISYINLPKYGKTPANGLLIIDKKEALILDTPWNNDQTYRLFNWVKNNYKINIKHVIINHFHDDNMGGLEAAHNLKAISYSLNITKEILKNKNKVLPKKTFKKELYLKLQNFEIIADYLGAGHTIDNIVIYLPKQKILFGGCLIKSLSSKNLGNIADADIKEWPKTVKKVLQKYNNAKIVIPGHGRYGGKELLLHTIELCNNHK
jgi:metallo-beta-lactamase class B